MMAAIETALAPRRVVCGCCPPTASAGKRERQTEPAVRGRAGDSAAATEASANTGVRGYSPPPPRVGPIRGLIDFHTHAAPDVFGRAVDDDELASLAATREMEAVVFKSHVTITADRAWLARKHVPGVKIFGGVTLNRAIGIGYLRKLPRDCFCPVNCDPIDLGGSESGIMGHVIDRWAMNQQVFVSPGLDRWFRASNGSRQ